MFCCYLGAFLSSTLIKEPSNHIWFSCQVIEISELTTCHACWKKAGVLGSTVRQGMDEVLAQSLLVPLSALLKNWEET